MRNRDYTISEMLKHILSQSLVAIVAIAITFLATGSFNLKKILVSSIAIIVVVAVVNLLIHLIKKNKCVDK